MNKAVLVMDMPETCTNCQLWNVVGDTHISYCQSYEGHGRIDNIHSKPDWCPLMPMPAKKDPYANFDGTIDIGTYQYAEAEGWNACLDTLSEKKG